ncbi:MAG: hypothetical protein WA749_14345 [Gelidibacter sp.]
MYKKYVHHGNQSKATSVSNQYAVIHIKQSEIDFGTSSKTSEILPNPAELLGAFSACMLKNVERFSDMMKFTYINATVEVKATRLGNLHIDHLQQRYQIEYRFA